MQKKLRSSIFISAFALSLLGVSANHQVKAESINVNNNAITLYSHHDNDNQQVNKNETTVSDNEKSAKANSDSDTDNSDKQQNTDISIRTKKGQALIDLVNDNQADLRATAKVNHLPMDYTFKVEKTIILVKTDDKNYVQDNKHTLHLFLDQKAQLLASKVLAAKIKLREKQYENAINQANNSVPDTSNSTSDASEIDSDDSDSTPTTDTDSQYTGQIQDVTNADNLSGQALKKYVLNRMVKGTHLKVWIWNFIITHESGWNPTIRNAYGYYGLFQLSPGYPGNGKGIKAQVDNAISLYYTQGLNAWEAWTDAYGWGYPHGF